VTVYGRPGCHLCDEALELIERVRASTPFELELVDITADDELHKRYLERIPVVRIDGREACELDFDQAMFERALRLSSRP
jgi:glutaredoxin